MRVFVTGATGFIGSAIVRELLGAGHQVVGLARTQDAAVALRAAGAEVLPGSLEDVASLKQGAEGADGVIHTAFNHDIFANAAGQDFFSAFLGACETDRRAIDAMGTALVGSDRPLVIASGTALLAPNRLGIENDGPDPAITAPLRNLSESLALSLAARGVRASVLRLPPSVHGDGDRHGFVPRLIYLAQEKGISGYVDQGDNRWPAVHRLDAALLFRLALERAPAGTILHGTGEQGVPMRDIASAIGRLLSIPVASVPGGAAQEHFGWLANFVGLDNPTSSDLTRRRMGWCPAQCGLIRDLEQGGYLAAVKR